MALHLLAPAQELDAGHQFAELVQRLAAVVCEPVWLFGLFVPHPQKQGRLVVRARLEVERLLRRQITALELEAAQRIG
jgi:hypothetical protein